MSTEKQQVAADIKQLVAELATQMDKAQEAGLVVELTTPNNFSSAHRGRLAVEVWEKTTY